MVTSLTKQESRARYIDKLIKHIERKTNLDLRPLAERAHRVRSSPSDHYYVSTQSRTVYNLSIWLQEHVGDRAIKVGGHSFRNSQLAENTHRTFVFA